MSIPTRRFIPCGLVLVVATLFCLDPFGAARAHAETVFFANKQAFLNAAGPQHLESFEGPPLRACSVPPIALAGVTISDTVALGVGNTVGSGIHPTDGAQYLKLGDCGSNSEVVVLAFSCPTTTFGISVVDFGE